MSRWLTSLSPWGAFLLRLVLGAAMLSHGSGKVIPAHGLHGSPIGAIETYSRFIATLGIPPWLGYVSALTEFLGGLCLLLGLFTRLSAAFIAINMLVAILAVNRHHGYSGSEYSLALLSIAFMLLLTGGGALALDRHFGLL